MTTRQRLQRQVEEVRTRVHKLRDALQPLLLHLEAGELEAAQHHETSVRQALKRLATAVELLEP